MQEVVELQYVVNRVRPTGLEFEVRVTDVNRDQKSASDVADNTVSPQTRNLRGFRAYILVSPEGVVTSLDRRVDTLRQMAGPEPLGIKLLTDACSDNVMKTWFGSPFWMVTDNVQPDTEWQRIDELSLGPMGNLRTIATCAIDNSGKKKTDDGPLDVTISGTGRHIPNISGDENSKNLLKFENVKLSMNSFSGYGKMVVPATNATDKEDDDASLRPWFESVSFQYEIEGQVDVVSSANKRSLSFSQTRKQVCRLLPGYQVGRPRRIPIESFDLPAPR